MIRCIYIFHIKTLINMICSILKHQLNTDILHKNGTCIQCHQGSAQFSFVFVLLNVILLSYFELCVRGTKTF